MDNFSGVVISQLGFPRRFKPTKVVLLAIFLYLGNVFAAGMPVDPLDVQLVVAPDLGVHSVLGSGGWAQVSEPVVGGVAINVVKVFGRKAAMGVEPSKPMSEVHLIPELDMPITMFIVTTSTVTDTNSGTERF